MEEARRRVAVRRAARLEGHPDCAFAVLARYMAAGTDGVREMLFGPSGVTPESVRAAAATWLPRHPGAALLVLPPRVFNPRFAAPPVEIRLDSDLAVAVLERGATPLATMAIRPVVSPDVDGELAAVVLTRLAGELRGGVGAPGWTVVTTRPALLEVAAPADGFPELVEALRTALETVGGDDTPVVGESTDARRRALQLTSSRLGLGASNRIVPSELLRPANLAVGAVVPDAEAGIEALRKLLVMEPRAAEVGSLPATPRAREAVAGTRSCLVIMLDASPAVDAATVAVVERLLADRARTVLADAQVEVFRPLVPGRRTVLVVVTAEATLDALERRIADSWPRLVGGATGSARECASLAAGEKRWRPASEIEMAILGVDPTQIGIALDAVGSFDALETAGAGVLPIPDAPPAS